jgi:hypothetical protein
VIHNCFTLDEGELTSVFGILGNRISSPFKRININQAVRGHSATRETRSKDRNESWAPSALRLSECESADDFKNSLGKPGEEGYPTDDDDKWELPQSCFVAYTVFEAFGTNCTMRAGDLAMELLYQDSSDDESEEKSTKSDGRKVKVKEEIEKKVKLLRFLWAVENFRTTKVLLQEAPDTDEFDLQTQIIKQRLEGGNERAEGQSRDHPSPSNDPSGVQTNDRIQSLKPPFDPPDKSPLAKSRNREGERGRRKRKKEMKKRSKRDSRSSSSSRSSSPDSSEEDAVSKRSSSRSEKSRSNSKGSRLRSKEKSPSRSQKTKSIRRRDSSSESSAPTKSIRTRRSPSSSSPGSSSSSDESSSDDSDSSSSSSKSGRRRPRKRGRRSKKRRRGGRRRTRRRRSRSSSGDERDLNKAMIRSLQAMTSSQIKRDRKEDKKKSMLSRLAPEAASLFTLLSAKSWKDTDPKLPELTKKILEDRDSNRALGEMKSISKRWNGVVSDKGVLSFLATGFAAADITDAPGGFSIFMFSPLGAVKGSDQKSKILQVRSMFGSTKLDEESIKYFAKNDFYLADTLASLEEQLFTCIKCLEKLTCAKGLASEGYWHGLNLLSQFKREFIGLVDMDALFPVKFAYLLDRAFQNFVQNLGDYHNSRDPIARAKKRLRGQQVRDIDAAMSGFKTGALSQLFLPRTLKGETPAKAHPSKDGGAAGSGTKEKETPRGDDTSKGKQTAEAWWSKNPSPVAAWKIPEGKNFKDFFDWNVDALKPNTDNWPKFKGHHPRQQGRPTHLCLKYQVVGRCSNTCKKAHIVPENIPTDDRKLMDEKFTKIYG